MGPRSRHISIGIDRPAGEVYDFAADPRNLPKWAAALAGSRVEHDGAHWFTECPMGRVTVTFAPRNDFGVLDHDVTLPSGETVYNPLRVISDGEVGLRAVAESRVARSSSRLDQEWEGATGIRGARRVFRGGGRPD
jgi:hypothetical protein